MGASIHIPTRLVTGAAQLQSADSAVTEALRSGLSQAVRRSSTTVLARAPAAIPVTVNEPEITWVGDGLSQVDQGTREETERRIREVVDDAVSGGRLRGQGGPSRDRPQLPPVDWIVHTPLYFQVPVRDYLDYVSQVAEPAVNYHRLFLDILPEQRWVTVWLVQVNSTFTARQIFSEVIARMNLLSPLRDGELPLWAGTPRTEDRDYLARIDRSRQVARRIGDIGRHNAGKVRGTRLEATYFRGARILFTRMRVPAIPSLGIASGQEQAFWATLRRTVFESQDAEQRRDVINTLIDLRMYDPARAILHEALDIDNFVQLGIRMEVVSALRSYRDDPPYTVARFLLYGLENEVDLTVYGAFVDWLKRDRGRPCLAFLQRVFQEDDDFYKRRAAKVVLHLLAWAETPEATPYRWSVRNLREFARRQDLWVGGALGEESLRQLIRNQISLLQDQLDVIESNIQLGPVLDPHEQEDLRAITRFKARLEGFADDVDTLNLSELEAAQAQINGILIGSLSVSARVTGMHEAIRRIRTFLQSDTAESDEVTVLFNLRHRYVSVLVNALDVDDFPLELRSVDVEGADFAANVAEFKWRRAHRDYRAAVVSVYENDTLNQWQRRAGVQSSEYHEMRRHLRAEMEQLRQRFYPRPLTTTGGTRIRVVDSSGRDVSMISHAIDLDDAINTETRVALFRIHMAMFGHVSVSLILESQIAEHRMGTTGFQSRTRDRLARIRRQIIEDWNQNRLQAFIDRDPEIVSEFEQIQREIRQAIREDIAIDLLITAITALLTVGTGLIVRGAMLGRTVGLIRTARAVETAVFLSEVGVFTATQLASDRLIHGRPVTLERTTEATIHNLVFLGGLRVFGQLAGPLLQRGGYGFVAFHGITAGSLTGVSALATRLTSGQWPEDMGLFLAQSLGSYVVFVGVASASRSMLGRIADPIMEARARQAVERLDSSNARLLRRYETAIRSGTLTEAEFQRIKRDLRSNVTLARELAQQMRNAGLRSPDEHQNLSRDLDRMDAMIEAAQFTAPPAYLQARSGARSIAALPLPDDVPGLVRQGTSRVFHYDAVEVPREVRSALSRYESAGYAVERHPSGLIRVSRPNGEVAFILNPGPRLLSGVQQPPLLTSGDINRPMTITERAMGRGFVTDAELQGINRQLRLINPRLLEVLEAEFAEPTVLSTLRIFTMRFPQGWQRWPINSVRGLATLLQPHRGVTLRPVLRLFETRSSAELTEILNTFRQISHMPRANRLIAEDIRPQTSIELIRMYDSLRRARITVPDNLSDRALWGLLRWAQEGRNVPAELGRIPLDQRVARLEADSPIVDPRIRPTTRAQQILQFHAREIRSGLNLSEGQVSEVVTAVEALGTANGGRFSDADVVREFGNLVTRYRTAISQFQAGLIDSRQVAGYREEINTILITLELGAEVFSLGNIRNIHINPALYDLPRGYRLINSASEVEIQFDVGARSVSGRLLLVEATTGELSLPRVLQGLRPGSGEPANGTIDWTALDQGRNASHRKWRQIIKIRAASLFAQDLGRSWGNAPVQAPDLVIRAGRVSQPAREVLQAMGFRIELTGSGSP